MNIVEERERVAEMTAKCMVDSEVIDGIRMFHAMMWCNAIGNYIFGNGRTVWEAVQNAHARHNIATADSKDFYDG